MLQAPLHAPHIGASVDQLDHVQQVLAAPGPQLQGVYRSAPAMNSNVACVIRPDRVSPWRAAQPRQTSLGCVQPGLYTYHAQWAKATVCYRYTGQ